MPLSLPRRVPARHDAAGKLLEEVVEHGRRHDPERHQPRPQVVLRGAVRVGHRALLLQVDEARRAHAVARAEGAR